MARQSRISHISDTELANYSAKQIGDMFYNGNVGAGYNAIVARGIKPKAQDTANGENGVKTTVVARAIVAKSPESPILTLPARVEEWMLDNILPDEWQDSDGKLCRTIPKHFIELVVLSDTADWNKRVRRLGLDELSMLEAFLGAPCTMNRREDAMLAEKAQAPFKAAQARIDAQAGIDAQLDSAMNRFESMRYDSNIVAFYAD